MRVFRFAFALTIALVVAVSTTSVLGGGLLGDAINVIAPGAGTALDRAHDQVKQALPPYRAIEEGATHVVKESQAQAAAPLLKNAILASRDDALNSGVMPIPPGIRANLEGFVRSDIMSRVRYRVRGGGDLSLQQMSIRYGDAAAITLDYVVVFKSQQDALYNASLWAHELVHVRQVKDWGLEDFSIRYARDSGGVENEAYGEQSRYAAWLVQQTARGHMASLNQPYKSYASAPTNGSTCSTAWGACSVSDSAPSGTPCWCGTAYGNVFGSIVAMNVNSPGTSRSGARPSMSPPSPQTPTANSCLTSMGACGLGVALTVGDRCYCPSPAGPVWGQAGNRTLASMCSTPYGSCGLGMALTQGDRCYCPSYNGPVWGQAQ